MRVAWIGVAALVLGACTGPATPPDQIGAEHHAPQVAGFSQGIPGGKPPRPWRAWSMAAFKRPTDYVLVEDAGRTVLKARAQSSASAMIHSMDFDPNRFPRLAWRWKVNALIPRADNFRPLVEDSPVRVVVAFDGDVSKLKPMDRVAFHKFRMIAKTELPYAMLMYIWENRAAPGTVISSAHTSRIKMIVADSGSDGLGTWSERSVDLVADFRRAFGEEPNRVRWIGVMTDTDNTGDSVQAYYGDIRVSAE